MDEAETDLALQWYKDTLACLERNGFIRRGVNHWWHPTLTGSNGCDTLLAFILASNQAHRVVDIAIESLKTKRKGEAS